MLIFITLSLSFGVYYALSKSIIQKIVGYILIGYGSNLFLLSCVDKNSPLMQSLVLTSIVIGIAITVLLVGKW